MTLKVYADRVSPPSRAVLIFCKVNGIDFEEVKIELLRNQHLTPGYREINQLEKVPAIVDGRFKLSESRAILVYLISRFPGVSDHWYPSDLFKRAKINSLLDWHHSNLASGIGKFFRYAALEPTLGLKVNTRSLAEEEKFISASLATIESNWLSGSSPFLMESLQPSIADLIFVCHIMQLEIVDEKDRGRILSPHKKVLKWIDNTKSATRPHFDEVTAALYEIKKRYQKLRSARSKGKTELQQKDSPHSKM